MAARGDRRHHARLLLQATPLLVPIIEEGRGEDDPLVRLALKQYLQPLAKHKPDVLVLGCTHYPIFKSLIARMLGPSVRVIDSAQQCAEDVARRLRQVHPIHTFIQRLTKDATGLDTHFGRESADAKFRICNRIRQSDKQLLLRSRQGHIKQTPLTFQCPQWVAVATA